jgi:hypothetical protein
MIRNALNSGILMLMMFLTGMVGTADANEPSGANKGGGSETGYRLSYTPIYQFDTDLDGGGAFDVHRHFFRLDISRPINRKWMVGVGLSMDYERWNFSNIDRLTGIDLWDEIFRPGISIPVFYTTETRWRLGIIPAFDFAGATGAETSESFSYGTVLSAAKVFGPNLMIGMGAGFFNLLDQFEAFPFLVVEWKITDNMKLTNPFEAGPVGPAGLELVYSPDEKIEVGIGGAYRSYRFRLDDSSAVSDGIGEVDFWASFLRVGWRLGKNVQVDFNGGALLDGSIGIEDADGNELGETGYDMAPFMGVTVKGRF